MTEINISKRRYHELGDMIAWCRVIIGTGGYIMNDDDLWGIVTVFGESKFFFVEERDATAFTLRWS
jgi:ABC-type uncharacterized transport system ATPase subunit